jgi:hypothetical protein
VTATSIAAAALPREENRRAFRRLPDNISEERFGGIFTRGVLVDIPRLKRRPIPGTGRGSPVNPIATF